MFNMPVIEHCEDQTLKGTASPTRLPGLVLGLRGILEAESIMRCATSRSRR
jgi:hypothetical protein